MKGQMKAGYDWRNNSLAREPEPEQPRERGALSRVEISIAENGFEVECRHKPPARVPSAAKSEPMCCDYDSLTQRYVFGSAKEVATFLAERLG